MNKMASFTSGAIRDAADDKPDYEGYLSPLALEAYGAYMTRHRHLPDGTLRASDNWQLGIPNESYMKSMWRHMVTAWKWHRGGVDKENMEESLCGVIFNAMGRLHNLKKEEAAGSQPKQKWQGWQRQEQMDPVPLGEPKG